jgi:hypothetical protein
MEALSKTFNFFSAVLENSPRIFGLGAMFYLVATTMLEVSATGVPFWSTLVANTQAGASAVLAAGTELIT